MLFPVLLALGAVGLYVASQSKSSASADSGKRVTPGATGPLTPSADACTSAFKALPPDVLAKVNDWRKTGGAANLRMAASFLELSAKSAPAPLNASMATAAACLRSEAEGSGAGSTTVPAGVGMDATLCKASLDALRKSPGWEAAGSVIDNGNSTELEALASSVEFIIPTVPDAATKAAMQQMVVCLRAMAKAKAASPGGTGAGMPKPSADTSKCLKDASGAVIPDLGLPNLLAVAPSIQTRYFTNAGNPVGLRALASELRAACQDQAATAIELEANALETASGGLPSLPTSPAAGIPLPELGL